MSERDAMIRALHDELCGCQYYEVKHYYCRTADGIKRAYAAGEAAGRAAGAEEEREACAALFCECRPLDLTRNSHSHDCDAWVFDHIRARGQEPDDER